MTNTTHRPFPLHAAKLFRLGRAMPGLAAALALAAGLASCNIVGAVGALEEARKRNSTHEIKAEYTGLEGKSFAVVVMADRAIQADFPAIVPWMTINLSEILKQQARASGYVPGPTVLQFQYSTPRWVTMSNGELAKELGVQRLIVIDLVEYRLNDPGNSYLWQGLAVGTVGVVEADSSLPDEPIMQKQIKVKFPDKDGLGPNDLPMTAVNTELARRFMARASWLFFDHQEKYYPDF